MSSTSLILVAQLALSAQMMDEVAAPAPPAECMNASAPDLEGVAEILTAPPGGHWWLRRLDEEGQPRFSELGPFVVVDGGGTEHAVDGFVYVTPAAVALPVPSTLEGGAVLQLRAANTPVAGALLRVDDEVGEPAAVVVESTSVQGTAPEQCQVFCAFPGMTVPAAPFLRLSASGGPAILDAWAVFERSVTDDLLPRVVDSQLVGSTDGAPFTFEHRLDEFGFTTGLDVRVRLLDPHTLEVLHDETRAIGQLPEVPVESIGDVEPCGDATPMDPGFVCAGSAPSSSAAMTLLLLVLASLVGRVPVRARAARSRRASASWDQ